MPHNAQVTYIRHSATHLCGMSILPTLSVLNHLDDLSPPPCFPWVVRRDRGLLSHREAPLHISGADGVESLPFTITHLCMCYTAKHWAIILVQDIYCPKKICFLIYSHQMSQVLAWHHDGCDMLLGGEEREIGQSYLGKRVCILMHAEQSIYMYIIIGFTQVTMVRLHVCLFVYTMSRAGYLIKPLLFFSKLRTCTDAGNS